ncbi:polysaccharide deacetylase family protein [Flexithrix dorotheae]|uniref:polysaccharide deacetylase family protein n=1 Tax=Flexithrix dorotheae TaxID=70993 RepID=UPI00035DFF3B|nr:polysaccharide deacetylase family protein [Flexithrix dorotheae]
MKKFFTLIILFCLVITGCAQIQQNSEEIKLIIRVDDIGFSHAVNLACMETLEKGVATSVEIMVPGPWFPEAAKMLAERPDLDVGIHLVLTSEWQNLKWRPLTHAPSLVDQDGYFHPVIWPNEKRKEDATFLLESEWKLEEIEAELRAQIELAKKYLPHLSHFTDHMGFTHMDPKVKELAKKLGEEYQIDIYPEDFDVQRMPGFGGSHTTPEEKVENFIKSLDSLTPGLWLFVDHPGLDTSEMQAIGHVGYMDVAADRNGVTLALTDERVKKAIKEKGIKLVKYSDLKKEN